MYNMKHWCPATLWKNDLRTVYSSLVDICGSMGSGWLLLLPLVLQNWEKSYSFGKLPNQPVTGMCLLPAQTSCATEGQMFSDKGSENGNLNTMNRGRKGVAFYFTFNPLGPALQLAQRENLISRSIAPCRGSNIPFHPKANLGEQGLHMYCSQRERW